MKHVFITAIATALMFGLLVSPALAKNSGPTKPNKPGRVIVKVTRSVSAGGAHLSRAGIVDSQNNGDMHGTKMKNHTNKTKNIR